MGLIYVQWLTGKIFRCKWCEAPLAQYDDILSKDFHGRYGRAYLFKHVVNIFLGPNEDRHLLTGLHTVNDIYCSSCQQVLGWRYDKACEKNQKYKEGKYILERSRVIKAG